jgi:starch synthase
MAEAIAETLETLNGQANFVLLGAGDPEVEAQLQQLKEKYPDDCNVYIGYNEELAHLVYAGADFLLMPSRVEPCGLNQLYAIRYGTVPMVRSTGGLKDTVIDFGDEGGYGIRYDDTSVPDIEYAISRALVLYKNNKHLQQLRKRMMGLDFSWDVSAKQYIDLYKSLIPTTP